MLKKHRARMPYKRFPPSAYTFLVTDFDSVFRRIDFFNTHACYRQLPTEDLRLNPQRRLILVLSLPGIGTGPRRVISALATRFEIKSAQEALYRSLSNRSLHPL